MIAFQVRVMVTARCAGYVTIDAETEELAIEAVRKIDVDSVSYTVDDDFYIDGDPVAFVRPEYDGTEETENVDDREVDLRQAGEPFSWEAVAIVKELGALGDRATSQELDALIERAVNACKKESTDA